jgi:hypothetical protein
LRRGTQRSLGFALTRHAAAKTLFILTNALVASLLLGLFALPSQQVIVGYPNAYPEGPVTSLLVERANWKQGREFPGRVMALYRSGSTLPATIDNYGRAGVTTIEDSRQLWRNVEGVTPDLASLKLRAISTFQPYGQLTSVGLYQVARDVFGNPGDITERNSPLNRRFSLTFSRLFGVKFVLADSPLEENGLRLLATVEGQPDIRLYEVGDSNTSGFSPTDLDFAPDWTEVRKAIEEPNFDPRVSAVFLQEYSQMARQRGIFGEARSSSIRLVGDGIEIDVRLASSQEPALVVLPFEFSHCMTVNSASGQSPAELVPVNGILTGLLVSESGRYEIQALTSPFRTPVCRLKDIQWWKRLFGAPS